MLKCVNLYSFVDRTCVEPASTITDKDDKEIPSPDFAMWTKKHDRVLSLLLSSLTEESMFEFVGLMNARDVWVQLEAPFIHSSPSRAHQLHDELQFLKRGPSSAVDYNRKFKLLCDQLAVIGQPVSESDKSHWFLRGLGPKFCALLMCTWPLLRNLFIAISSIKLEIMNSMKN